MADGAPGDFQDWASGVFFRPEVYAATVIYGFAGLLMLVVKYEWISSWGLVLWGLVLATSLVVRALISAMRPSTKDS